MKALTVYKGEENIGIRGGIVMGGKLFAAVLLLCAICAVTYGVARFFAGDAAVISAAQLATENMPIIVIDAGHGGMDGGASGADGTLEKDINLAVAMRISELFKVSGIDCVMTRTDDRMIVDDSVTSRRKMHDLKNRLAVTEKLKDDGENVILVSIHMNNFSVPKYSGLQVWYSPNNDESAKLASYVQGYARSFLDKSNSREIKKATSSIYILDRASVPAILVECGFLSNPEECKKLASAEYQNEIAVTIFTSLCGWIGSGK